MYINGETILVEWKYQKKKEESLKRPTLDRRFPIRLGIRKIRKKVGCWLGIWLWFPWVDNQTNMQIDLGNWKGEGGWWWSCGWPGVARPQKKKTETLSALRSPHSSPTLMSSRVCATGSLFCHLALACTSAATLPPPTSP